MHDQPGPWREQLPPEVPEDDETMRLLVLTLVLSKHPDGMSVPDLVSELRKDTEDDSVERAARDLLGVGLLRRERGRLVATFIPPAGGTADHS